MGKSYMNYLIFSIFIFINSQIQNTGTFIEEDEIQLIASCDITEGVYYFTESKIGHIGRDGVTEIISGISLGLTPSSQISMVSCYENELAFAISCTSKSVIDIYQVYDNSITLYDNVAYSEDIVITDHKCTISYSESVNTFDVGYSVFSGRTLKIINIIYSLVDPIKQVTYNTIKGEYTSGDIDTFIFCYSQIQLCIYRKVNVGINMKYKETVELISATDSNFRYYYNRDQVSIYFKENDDLYVYLVMFQVKIKIKSIYNNIKIDNNFYGINYDGMDYCIITYLNGYTGNSAISEYFILDSLNNEYVSFSLIE